MATKKVDAIVIGAGPAGAAAARRLVEGGMETLLVEKEKLPRQKMCSGLLSPWSVSFVHRRFGVIPPSVYTRTPFLRGVAIHAPSLAEPVYIPGVDPIPYIWRDRFDHFLVKGSGAAVRDGLRMVGIEEAGEGYEVLCVRRRKDGKPVRVRLRARYVVAADGANSRAVRLMLPEALRGLPWATAVQVYCEGRVDLDPGYFHTFFHRGIGVYPWANVKDDWILVGALGIGRRKAAGYLRSFLTLLEADYHMRIDRIARREGMAAFMMAPLGRFALGKDDFLAAGDAAGFMHNGGEGISCALNSGDLAGQAVLQAAETGFKALTIYRRIVEDEVALCLDQTNPLRMFKTFPMALDLKAVRRRHSLRDLYLLFKDIRAFGTQDNGLKETGVGAKAKENMVFRLLHGRYPEMDL